jgi:ADP-ribosyl-[dinitrogen reductase] hydrolase
MSTPDAAAGALLGLACGDALGRPVESQSTQWIADTHGTVTEMLGDGTHEQPQGTVTDDTDLALCIARSLVEWEAFDGQDVADRFVGWYEDGPFDVGLMTADAITEYRSGTS